MRAAILALVVVGLVSCEKTPSPAPASSQATTSATTSAPDPALTRIDAFLAGEKIDKTSAGWKTSLPVPPEDVTFDSKTAYLVKLETSKGALTIRLRPDVAPYHATSFLMLTRTGFFDGLTFHRVVPGFMAQGGCPAGDGTGHAGYEMEGEFVEGVTFDRPFLVASANAGPGTDGSQFFITFVPTPHLDGRHTIFGEVVEGQDTVKALEKCGTEGGLPTETLRLTKATVVTRPK